MTENEKALREVLVEVETFLWPYSLNFANFDTILRRVQSVLNPPLEWWKDGHGTYGRNKEWFVALEYAGKDTRWKVYHNNDLKADGYADTLEGAKEIALNTMKYH